MAASRAKAQQDVDHQAMLGGDLRDGRNRYAPGCRGDDRPWRTTETIDAVQRARRVIRVWEAVRGYCGTGHRGVGARLTLKQHNGQRVVSGRALPVSKQFRRRRCCLTPHCRKAGVLQVYHPRSRSSPTSG
jgi:hypothetical protein